MVECQLPKLDVAGSNPVSRSIFSITWKESSIKRYSVYSVFFLNSAERPFSRLPALEGHGRKRKRRSPPKEIVTTGVPGNIFARLAR